MGHMPLQDNLYKLYRDKIPLLEATWIIPIFNLSAEEFQTENHSVFQQI